MTRWLVLKFASTSGKKRINDYDDRGYLSQRYLGEFCRFFLATAVDQVEFMEGLLALDGMLNRITGDAERRESARELSKGTARVLREIFLRGEISRGEVARVIGVSPRTAISSADAIIPPFFIPQPCSLPREQASAGSHYAAMIREAALTGIKAETILDAFLIKTVQKPNPDRMYTLWPGAVIERRGAACVSSGQKELS